MDSTKAYGAFGPDSTSGRRARFMKDESFGDSICDVCARRANPHPLDSKDVCWRPLRDDCSAFEESNCLAVYDENELKAMECTALTMKELLELWKNPIQHFFGAKLYITTPCGCLRVDKEFELHGIAEISWDEQALVSEGWHKAHYAVVHL